LRIPGLPRWRPRRAPETRRVGGRRSEVGSRGSELRGLRAEGGKTAMEGAVSDKVEDLGRSPGGANGAPESTRRAEVLGSSAMPLRMDREPKSMNLEGPLKLPALGW
jgi:hypothetical protein